MEEFSIPWTSLRTADVMKTLITSSRTAASNNCRGDSRSWHAIIIIAYEKFTVKISEMQNFQEIIKVGYPKIT